jgi:conjugal transfer/entry exclusion protein
MRRPVAKRLTSLALALLTLSLHAAPAPAQIAALVFDPTNYTVNTLTSIQSVITAVESVAQTANMVLELSPLDSIVAAQGIAADMAQLSALAQDAEGLMQDVSALQA